VLKYKLFLDFLIKNGMLNKSNRIKGQKKFKGDMRYTYKRVICILHKLTSWLDNNISNQVRMRYVLNNMTEKNIICPVCNKENKQWVNEQWTLTCNNKDKEHLLYLNSERTRLSKEGHFRNNGGWAMSNKEIQEKGKRTRLKKYGVEHYAQTSEFKEFMQVNKDKHNNSRIKTTRERYGVDYACQNEKIKIKCSIKTKEALLLKYGVEHPTQIPGINQKISTTVLKTCNQKFGGNSPSNDPKIYQKLIENRNKPVVKRKIEDTNLKRYGVLYHQQTEVSKEHLKNIWHLTKIKIEETNLKRYGVLYYNSSLVYKTRLPQIKQKMEDNNLKKYGLYKIEDNKPKAKTFMQSHMVNTEYLNKEYINDNFINIDGTLNMKKMMSFYHISETTCYNYCSKFNVKFKHTGGFNPTNNAIMYYLQDTETGYYKIGITNNDVMTRFNRMDTSRIKLIEEWSYEVGKEAQEAEKEILEFYSSKRIVNEKWPEIAGGKTEFFTEDVLGLDI